MTTLHRLYAAYGMLRSIFAGRSLLLLSPGILLIISLNKSFGQFGYGFSQTAGTYTAITGGNVLFSGTFDDNISAALTIPSFNFNGQINTQMFVSANGFLTFGSTAPVGSLYTPISSTTSFNGVVAPFAVDLIQSQAGSPEVRWEVLGNEIVVQWRDVRRWSSSPVNEQISFQVRLNSVTGGIQIVYGGTIAPSTLTNYPQVGIRGATNLVFDNRSVVAATGNWINSTRGTLNSATCYFNNANAGTVPSAGLTFSYIFPTADNIISTSIGGDWGNPGTWVGGVVPDFLDNVTIANGATVTVNVSPSVASLTVGEGVSGILNFNASASRILTVNGNLTVQTGASFTSVPTIGTSTRQLSLAGNLVNNGACDFSQTAFVLAFLGTTPQSFGGSGTFANSNGVGIVQINNPAGVTALVPIRVPVQLDLINGNFNVGSALSFNYTIPPTATATTIRRSPLSQIVGTPLFVSDTINIQYVFFTGQTSALITTGAEVPTSRRVHTLTISNPAGVTLSGGDLNVFSTSTPITFTTGVLNVGSSNSVFFVNPSSTIPAGSDASHINGPIRFRVNSASAVSRTLPIGSGGLRRPVTVGGLNTGSVNLDIRISLVSAPSGTTVAPVTATQGVRGYRLESSAALPATTSLTLNWLGDDQLIIGNQSELRIVQSPGISGPWTERSVSSGTGSIPLTGSRTTVSGISTANGEFFAWGSTAPIDVAVTGLLSPSINVVCFGAEETIQVNLRSVGATIDFSAVPLTLSGSYVDPSNNTVNLPTVNVNSGTLAAGGNLPVSFPGTSNLSAKGTYRFTFVITGDPNAVNDTLRTSIENVSYTASANPSTILTGDSSVLSVGSNAFVRITEVTLFRTGTGATATYPTFLPSTIDDMIEITNLSTLPADLSGDSALIVGTGARTFVFPAGTILGANQVLVLAVRDGINDPANRVYYTQGTASPWSSGNSFGIILKKGNMVYDAVALNAQSFSTAQVPLEQWSGIGAPALSGRAGASLLGPDVNSATNWSSSNTPSPLQTLGSLNPGLTSTTLSVSWSGPGGFTGTTPSVSTGVINTAGNRNYTASVNNGGCITTATASLNVQVPVPPAAGFTVSSTTANTGGAVSTITFTDTSLNLPNAWLWSFSPSTVTFVNSTSATSRNPQVQFNVPGTYSVSLQASNGGGSGSVTRTNLITVVFAFCASNATNTGDTKIDSVQLGNLVTGSAPTTCETYTNYSSAGTVSIEKLIPFSFRVRNGSCSGSHFGSRLRIFIDFNRDGLFNDLSEVVFTNGATTTGLGTITGSILIPDSAGVAPNRFRVDTGIARMRIILQESSIPSGCGTFAYGETEDYQVRILPAPPCGPVASVTVGSITSNIATVRWTRFPLSTNVQVRYGLAGFGNSTLGGTTLTTTADSAVLSSLAPQSQYHVYLRTFCGADSSAWVGPVAFNTGCNPTQPLPFTESFETNSSSITCWSAEATSWSVLSGASAFGLGNQSIRFNFFNVNAGTRVSAFSPVTLPATAGYSLVFDHAYATYTGGERDSLIILTSSDGGTSWLPLDTLVGGPTGILNTFGGTGQTSANFVPTAGQWGTLSRALPVGTNRVRFLAISAFGNNLYLDNISIRRTIEVVNPVSICNPSLNSRILIGSVSGGTAPYRFTWNNNVNRTKTIASDTFVIPAAGTYSLRVITGSGDTLLANTTTGPVFTGLAPPAGTSVAGITMTSAILNWSSCDAPVPSGYQVWISNGIGVLNVGPGFTFNLTGLVAGTVYRWSVRALYPRGLSSAWTDAGSFATIGNTPCSDTLINLTATAITSNGATLNWQARNGASAYQVWVTGRPVVTVSTNSLPLTGLTSGTTYNWAVRVLCSNGLTSAYANAVFTTSGSSACVAPTGLNATFANPTSNFTWNPVSANSPRYQIWIQGTGVVSTLLTSPTYSTATIVPGSTVSWTVRTLCAGGITSAWATPNSSFTASRMGELGREDRISVEEMIAADRMLDGGVAALYEIELYPNPASNSVVVRMHPDFSATIIELFDMRGYKLMEWLNPKGSELLLDVSSLPPGAYSVRVINNDSVLVKPLLKQ